MSRWQRFKNKYRADEVPWYWQVPFWIVSLTQFVLMASYVTLVHFTARVRVVGTPGERNAIYAGWHTHAFVYFCVFLKGHGQVWLTHPSWYMKSIHLWKKLIGLDILLGSTGHGGRAAALTLQERVKNGDSTVLMVDGPYGPWGEVKKGILHLAKETGAPIIPIRFDVTGPHLRMKHEDRKRFPLPFSTITATYGPPIFVASADFASALAELTASLGSNAY